jgi:ABC-type phosphate/phosphonate transport system substrate-binding protein
MERTTATGRRMPVLLALAGAVFVCAGDRGTSADQPKPEVLKIGTSGTLGTEKGGKEKGAQETLRKFIQDETGMKNEIGRPTDWRELAEKMSKGELHVGVFQGFEFAWAKEKYPDLRPLALAVNVHLYPVVHVVTKANNPATDVAALKGQSVTIPIENQPDLRLYLDHQAKAGGKPETFFSKVNTGQNVEDALDDVVDGAVAAAVADQAALETFRRRKPARFKQLKQVAHSAPLPPVVIAVYDKVLDQDTRDRFSKGLIGANKKEAGQTMLTLFKLTGFQTPPADFEKVLTATRQTYPPPAK